MGREFVIGEGDKAKKTGPGLLTFVARAVYAGGLRYTPGTIIDNVPVFPLEDTYTSQLRDYFRIDLRAAYRKSFRKTAIQFSLDVQNVTGRENQREELWDEGKMNFIIANQSGTIPVFSLQFDF